MRNPFHQSTQSLCQPIQQNLDSGKKRIYKRKCDRFCVRKNSGFVRASPKKRKIMLRFAALLILVFVTSRASAQCLINPSDIWLVLDESEGARAESNNFIWLRETVLSFARDNRLLNPTPTAGYTAANLIRIGLISYSAIGTVTLPLTSPSSFISLLGSNVNNLIPGVPSTSSLTAQGLQQVVATTDARNKYVLLISNSGSFSTAGSSQALAAANQLKSRGYTVFVYGVSSNPGNLYETELRQVGGTFYEYVSNYNAALQNALLTFITNYLCEIVKTPCSECSLGRGTYLFEAPSTCEKFYQCLPNKAYILQDCAAGTLFNKVTGRCEVDQDYDCDAWGGRCKENQQETFKAQCCTQYFQCSNKAVTLNNCPTNQVYRDNSLRCTPKTSADQNCDISPACRPSSNLFMTEALCRAALFDVEPNSRCKFRHYRTDNRQLYEVVDCAEGSAWNQGNCTCVPDTACIRASSLTFKALPSCSQATVHVDFNGQPRGISDVPGVELNIWVDTKGSAGATGLTLDGSPGRTSSIAYMPYFNMQTFPGDFALITRFAITQSIIGQTYDILVNDYCGECTPSIYIRAQVTSSNTVVASLKVRSQANQEVNIQSSVSINAFLSGQTPLLKVTAIFVRTDFVSITFRVDTSDASGNSLIRGTTSTGQISDIAIVPCGLAIGKGPGNPLVGIVDDPSEAVRSSHQLMSKYRSIPPYIYI